MIIKKADTEHYNWGENSEGWHLVKTPGLSVIEERMPPGATEVLHFHEHSQQFFYILSGIASFEVEADKMEVHSGEGIHLIPGQKHLVANDGKDDLCFLLISQPEAQGDRTSIIL